MFCIVLRKPSHLLLLVFHRSPSGASAFFRRLWRWQQHCTPHRADLLALPESSVRATPVQDLVRREDSEYFVGLKEKILLSSEEFRETAASEGHARVHVDPALKRASVYKRLIWRLVSLGMVRLSLDAECECGVFCVWNKNGKQRVIVNARSNNQRC